MIRALNRLETGGDDMRSLQNASSHMALAPMPQMEQPPLPDLRKDDREWTISEVSKAYGLTLRALRFYESRGLISPKRFGGARYFTTRCRSRLKLILAAKQMGFTLSETATMIGRSTDGETELLPLSEHTLKAQIEFLEGQKSTIDGALKQLTDRLGQMRTAAR